MFDFAKISGSDGFVKAARFVLPGCRASDNFRKVENARFRVACFYISVAGNARQSEMGRAFFV